MKLYELLSEAPKKKTPYTAKSFFDQDDSISQIVKNRGKTLVDYINKNCSQWYQESKGKPLYRGFDSTGINLAFTKKVRKDRNPKDSKKRDHIAFNMLIKQCGKVANRSNALFASGDQYVASEYGKVYVIFPIGNYNYTWHTQHDDWHEMPWYEYLQKKVTLPKNKMASYKKEYEKLNAYHTEHAGEYVAGAREFFAQFGIKITKASLNPTLRDELARIVQAKGEQTFNIVKQTNPFMYASASRKPRVSWYDWDNDGELVKSAPMKKLYDVVVNGDLATRKAVLKGLKKIDKLSRNSNNSRIWLKYNGSLEEFIRNEEEGAGDMPKNAFKVGKDKPSQIDTALLQKWCKGLKGDDGTLATGIASENEVMVACNTILAIEENFYEYVVRPMLKGKDPKINDATAQRIMRGEDPDSW